MSWTEITPGRYQRPLGGAENGMIAAITGERQLVREPIRIHAFADFMLEEEDPADVIAAFRDAWKALRLLKSPDIATTYGDGHSHYKVPSVEELERWLQQTFRVAQGGISAQVVVKEMQSLQEMLPVFYIVPQHSEAGFKASVILFISHWRTEAAGAFKMISHVLGYASDILSGTSTREALSRHLPGSEARLLNPTLEDIMMPNKSTTPESKSRIQQLLEDYDSKLPPLDFPMQRDPSTIPSSVKLKLRRYKETTTSSLVNACKARGISVTAAVHSAYLEAVWQLADNDKKSRNYASMMPAQVRTRLPPTSRYRDQGAWNASQMLMMSALAGQDFLTRALDLKRQYAIASQQTWLYEDMREMSEQLGAHPLALEASMPWFTSHGVLDQEMIPQSYGKLKVESILVFADPVLGPGIVLGVWTFRGKMTVEVHWNTAFYRDDIMQSTLDIIDQTLSTELGLNMEIEGAMLTEF
ncbi:uncharacterized protein A1O9_12290 [Exophiala aquamarina CBS 119918]|uniref:Condensation domain-containing protein n=1 Tax=Exophiala aquamarina CBS 119918 TaxID=1182545 RepID=A0A072P7R7_9EURO|nr:uncharacterized protein A1O9_12290 [Exophiala aquamarina CBS 119918]KEF51655.1 hypothetical protein A1O9_12290 [Exophiala aquamarina CBS 119918]